MQSDQADRHGPPRIAPLPTLLIFSWLLAVPLLFFALVCWIVVGRSPGELSSILMVTAGLTLAAQLLAAVVCLTLIVLLRPRPLAIAPPVVSATPAPVLVPAPPVETLRPAINEEPNDHAEVGTNGKVVTTSTDREKGEHPVPPGRQAAPLARVVRTGTDVADERTRTKRASDPSVADSLIDRGLWEDLKAYLKEYPHQEQGGFVLGAREGVQSRFLAVVFPKQVSSTATHCEFSTEDIYLIREALDATLGDDQENIGVVTAWIHTHPNLSVFLSGTDRATIKRWFGIDRRARAAVVDVFKPNFNEQFAVFDSDFRRVSAVATDLPLPAGFRDRFLATVEETYRRHRREVPFIATASETRDIPEERR